MNNNLLNFPQKETAISLLIRHAERDPIDTMANALAPTLTVKGKNDSYKLGRMLAPFGPFTIFHSPVPRCQETAQSISEGISSCKINATVAGMLLDLGGPYITGDWDGIVKSIDRLGHANFVRKWFDNELPPELIMSLPEAARIQLRILVDTLRSSDTSSIHVTHDWNIMIVREYYFHLRHEDIGDPDYLDGVLAYLRDTILHLRYHEHEAIIDLSDTAI
jgi:phosphohistidine phosphatase SixA